MTPSDDMMESLPYYRSKYDEAKKIHVYFIPARNLTKNTTIFFYAIASSALHEHMLRCLKAGDIPDFAVVVEKGEGAPTDEIKAKIKAYYGFDHDAYI